MGGFSSLLATIQHLSSLLLDLKFSILLFGFLRLNPFVILNFNLTPADSALLESGIIKSLWSVSFGSSSSVFVDKIGSGIVGGSSLGCF